MSDHSEDFAAVPQPAQPAEKPRKNPLRTALMLAGSAAVGGLAVALWHRRTLTELRRESAAKPTVLLDAEDE